MADLPLYRVDAQRRQHASHHAEPERSQPKLLHRVLDENEHDGPRRQPQNGWKLGTRLPQQQRQRPGLAPATPTRKLGPPCGMAAAWQTQGQTTLQLATFLSPQERVSARGRAKQLLDIGYICEICKKAETRPLGPTTMPILYGGRLVGRMDARLGRARATLIVNGRWLAAVFAAHGAIEDAWQAGLQALAGFLGAQSITNAANG